MLKSSFVLAMITVAAAPSLAADYRFPIQLPSSGTQPYITAHRDNNTGNAQEDYACGTNTYQNHKGTDIGIGGFAQMDAGSRVVVAAEAGVVQVANDGCFDRCTTGTCDCGGGFGNYVRILHPDGLRTYYGHLQIGSVAVSVGQQVECGTVLGRVGSSGQSSGPHLHFEPRTLGGTAHEPFSGQCGGPLSYWVTQRGYGEIPGDTCAGGEEPPPPATTGDLRGAVFEDLGVGTADMSVRIAGATVTVLDTELETTAAGELAEWSFDAPLGSRTIRASAPGYESAERTCDVTAGATTWCSVGLVPSAVVGEGEGEGEPAGEGEGEPAEGEGEQPSEGEGEQPEDFDGEDVERVNILPPAVEGCAASGSANAATSGSALALVLLALLGRARRSRR